MLNYANKLEVTLLSIFGELIKAYSDSLEPDPFTPRQQPASVLMSMLRLMDRCGPGCEKMGHAMAGRGEQ